MKSLRIVSLVALAGSIALCGSAGAATVFYDNFQSDTAGTTPTAAPLTNLNPWIGAGDVGTSWSTSDYENDVLDIQVLNNQDVGASDGIAGANNYLKVSNTSGTVAVMDGSLTHDKSYAAVSFDLWLPTGGSACIAAFDGIFSGRSVDFRTNSSTGAVSWCDGTHWPPVSTSLVMQFGTWQHVVLAANMVAQTFSITVGDSTASDLAFLGNGSQIGVISFGANSSTGVAYLDNVTVTNAIPEPSSIVLVVSGVVGLLAYAWRKRK